MINKRKLLDGSEIISLDKPIQIIIHTKAPRKWKIIDMETGQEYIGSETKHPFYNNFLKEKIKNTEIGSLLKVKEK